MQYKICSVVVIFVVIIVVLFGIIPVNASDKVQVPVNGVLDLSASDEGKVQDLDGEWRLFPQRFVPPDKIQKEADYVLIDVPDTWEYTMYQGSLLSPQTFATYYLQIILPQDTNIFSLYIPDISSAYRLFINNELIIQMGRPSDTPENEVGKWKPTVVTFAPQTNTVNLVLHVSNFHHNDGGMWESIKIGPVENIYFIRILGLMRGILISGILFAFTFYFMNFFFVVKPRNHSALYLALSCFLALVREFATKDVPLQFLFDDSPFEIQVALEYLTLCGLAIFITEYILYNFNTIKYLKYFKRLLDAILVIIIAIIILSPMVYYTSLVIPIQIIVIANLLLILIVTVTAMIRHNKEAGILFTGSLLLLYFTTMEMAFINRFFEKSVMFDMGTIVFILFLTLLIHLHNRLTNKAFTEASRSKDREVAFLRAQIVPHFINNALSNAIYLTENSPTQAKTFLLELSNLMVSKYNFNAKNPTDNIPLQKELEIVRSYVYIQNIRFNNKITFIEDIDERALDMPIPPLLIQPLIENAITHGLSSNDKPSSVLALAVSLEKGFLNITVKDNGTGISIQKLIEMQSSNYAEAEGIGIKNIKERISNIKGASFNISSKLGVETTVVIKVPGPYRSLSL